MKFYSIAYKSIEAIIYMSWRTALLIAVTHAVISYVGLYALGEANITSTLIHFSYYYLVTGSTVGYGDYSPTTDMGMLFSSLWVIPGAIAIFAFLLGKIIATSQEIIGRIIMGLGEFNNKTDHIVILGYQKKQTENLLREIQLEYPTKEIIIGHTSPITHLSGGHVKTIIMESLSNLSDLKRAGVKNASHVLILIEDDDKTISSCLAVDSIAHNSTIVAHFNTEEAVKLIEHHCDNIICILSNEVEKMSRALSDPETPKLASYLFSSHKHKSNMRAVRIKIDTDSIKAHNLAEKMIKNYEANLVGFHDKETKTDVFYKDFGQLVKNNDTVYYISMQNLGNELNLSK